MPEIKRNLVIIGSHLWDYPDKHAKTSFCCHIDRELDRAGGDIDVYAFEQLSMGIYESEPYLKLPDGTILSKGDPLMPDWALCYVVPPRAVFMLEQLGITCFSSYEMLATTEDKMVSHVLYADVFKQPDTLMYRSAADALDILNNDENYPFMLKGVSGCCGDNVAKADNSGAVLGFELTHDDESDLNMYQKLMPTADDLRVYILGDEIIGAIVRKPKPGVWKANLALGPTREPYELSESEIELQRGHGRAGCWRLR